MIASGLYNIAEGPKEKSTTPKGWRQLLRLWGTRKWADTKRSRVFSLPQTTPEHYVKDRQRSSSETIKTKLGRKQVIPCEVEKDLAEHCLLMARKFFGLTVADVMRLAYQLAVRNGIKKQFCKRMKWLKNFLRRHQEISVTSHEGLSLSKARGFNPESVAQYF